MQRVLHTTGVGERQATVSGKAIVLRSVITVFWVLIGYVSMAQPIYFDEVFDGPSVTENMFNGQAALSEKLVILRE